ncbi:acyl carrier protein [Neolewinella antarctica]|uniref:Acyl carrier protein n=1 Tax=Neolewinella antarctica TaxID=442734 RepID=A0ABX0XA39_9BACT|nr:acyl carrier protein [Neolewinella antarctica]NJC26126.1 acyl carrier protein [Neolewinella antarctica]
MSVQMDKFIENLREQYEMLEDQVVIDAATKFKELEDWDSLVALSVIAMADEEYRVKISGDDIRSVTTVRELHDLVRERIGVNH